MIPPAKTPPPRGAVKNKAQSAYMARVLAQMLEDLKYPQAQDGSIADVSYIAARVAWHLTRAGWRKPNNTDGFALVEEFDDPVIKARRVLGPGVYEDAVVWVGFNEPDDPLAGLEDMSMRDIEALPDEVKYEAKRRLGLISIPTPDDVPKFGVEPWSVKPEVTIIDAPYEDDDNTNSREG